MKLTFWLPGVSCCISLHPVYGQKSKAVMGEVALTIGHRKGTETVQVSLRDNFASVTRPVQELKSFRKASLRPGENRTIEFTLRPADLAFYDLRMKYGVEPGTFTVMAGGISSETLSGKFEVAP